MKKSVIITICIVAILVVACIIGFIVFNGNRNNVKTRNGEENENYMSSSNESTESNLSNSADITSSGKTLVVYYSAQNHTKNVAEQIAKNLNADIFEIEPEEPYSTSDLDWTNDNSRVNKEHEDESLRNIKLKTTSVPNWDEYNTVFIGYPIWWGIAAWPTDTFIKSNDFTGKNVYAFCTSYSSGLGQSMSLLQKEANSGNWKEGHRFSSSTNSNDIEKWVKSLDL